MITILFFSLLCFLIYKVVRILLKLSKLQSVVNKKRKKATFQQNYQKWIFKMLSLKKIKVFELFFRDQLFKNGKDWSITILRIIPSFYMFYYHGMRKISGSSSWNGSAAAMSVIGVEFGFYFLDF